MLDGRITRRLLPALLVLGMVLALVPGAVAQPSDLVSRSEGTEFWLTIQPNRLYYRTEAGLAIAGAVGTAGSVNVPGREVSLPFAIPDSGVAYVSLDAGDVAVTTMDGIEPKAIHVTADADVRITGYNSLQFAPGAYLALSSAALGTDYLVLDYTTFPLFAAYSSQLLVVATADETTVTITPSVTAGGRTAEEPYDVQLDAGDVYHLALPQNILQALDLTGTSVAADNPVAVFAGHVCAYIPDQSVPACDPIIEQLPPVDAWGQTFLTLPLARNSPIDVVRILAATDGTVVTINGTEVATLNRGEYRQVELTAPAEIGASHPVLVAQYALGGDSDVVIGGDPLMMLVPPVETFQSEYRIASLVPITSATERAHVIAPVDAVASVTLNGNPVAADEFIAIGDSGYAGAQLLLPSDGPVVHTIASSAPIGVIVYGFSYAAGYGYPAGWGLARARNVAPTVEITSPTDGAVVAAGSVNLSAAITDPNTDDTHTCAIDWGSGSQPGDVSTPGICSSNLPLGAGMYDITVTVTDDRGLSATDGVAVTVIDPALMAAGSGVIMSPRGAVAAAPTAVNRAIFSFAVAYPDGAMTPAGPVTFTYSHGTFQATTLELLLIEGAAITIQGSGTLNGSGDYAFTLSAVDGSPDGFRIQIRDGASVVYDNGSVQSLLGGLIMIRP